MPITLPFTLRLFTALLLLHALAAAQPVPTDPPQPPASFYIDARLFLGDWPKICQGANTAVHAINPDAPPIHPALAVQSLDDLRVDYLIRQTHNDPADRTINQPRRMLAANVPTLWEISSLSPFASKPEPPTRTPLIFAGRYLATPGKDGRITLHLQFQLLPQPGQTPPAADPNSVFTVNEMTLTLDIDPADKPTLCIALPFTPAQIAQCYQSDFNDPRDIPKNLPPNAVLLLKLNPVLP